jgi:hypothetical protein
MTDWTTASDSALRTAIADDMLRDKVMAQLGAHDLAANTRTYDMRESALYYARRLRWPVFPLRPGDKKPATAHGFHDATTELEQISAWWARMPEANIGTPTGAAGCGYDVIDVDMDPSWADPHMGFRSWADMLHNGCADECSAEQYCPGDGTLDIQAIAVTPRGGRHYYIPAVGTSNAAHIRPGIDLRGDGGYVAVAPSLVGDRRYTWVQRPETPS